MTMKKITVMITALLLMGCSTTYDLSQGYRQGEQLYMDNSNKCFVVKRDNKYYYLEMDANNNYTVGGEIRDAYYLSKVHGAKVILK